MPPTKQHPPRMGLRMGPDFCPSKNLSVQRVQGGHGGEGGIRTHGTVTRTTVFEFYDSHAGPCRSVGKRAAWFGILTTIISSCDVPYRFVTRSWFAIWFANFPPARVRLPRQSGHHKAGSQKTVIHKANTQKRCSRSSRGVRSEGLPAHLGT
jgi:hypothetical protein